MEKTHILILFWLSIFTAACHFKNSRASQDITEDDFDPQKTYSYVKASGFTGGRWENTKIANAMQLGLARAGFRVKDHAGAGFKTKAVWTLDEKHLELCIEGERTSSYVGQPKAYLFKEICSKVDSEDFDGSQPLMGIELLPKAISKITNLLDKKIDDMKNESTSTAIMSRFFVGK